MKKLLLAAAMLLAAVTMAYAGNTVLFSSQIGDVTFPITPTTIDKMAIGLTTPAAAQFTGIVAGEVYNTDSQTATIVLTAADLSGGSVAVDLGLTGAITTAQNAQLPTVASIVAALPAEVVGQTFRLRVINVGGTSSGAFTVTTNTGWTLHGNVGIAINTWHDFLVTYGGTGGVVSTAVLQSLGSGTFAAS